MQMNCMALSSARAAFGAIARELLGADHMPTNDTEALDRIQERLTDATAPMAYVWRRGHIHRGQIASADRLASPRDPTA